ncbi:MAG: endonuclease III [Bacilli bacterium]|nr:endonuclease III [Bacilli bacterium]
MKNKIIDYLNELINNPKSELNYNHDYELLISVMMSAQTTDKRVNQVTSVLYKKYNSLEKLSKANLDDVKNIIKSVGTFNKKAVNVIEIAKKLAPIGYVPNDRNFLESLPGVGRKTTNVVLGIIYNEQVIAVDTHVKRVAIRLGIAEESDDVLKVEKKLTKYFKGNNLIDIHHKILLFGRYYCTARNPKCDNCKLRDMCKYYNNMI